ncbi:MAG: RNA-binding protein [Crocinitomicaceae bacterium]|jgi:RNA recognition motif-containing protein
MNIFVAKLDYGVTSDDLREVFEEYGEVTSCSVIMDKMTRKSKGFAFVEMPESEQANKAISELNEASINGRTIVVKEAEERAKSNKSW